MKRALIFIVLTSGCAIHVETTRNAPAHLASNIETPPKDLVARGIEHGEVKGMQGWLGHMMVYGGANVDSKDAGGTMGFEIGATPFALDKYHMSEAPFEAQASIWIRPSIGWMVIDESNRRLTAGRPGANIGPVYGEIQVLPYQGKGGFGAVMVGVGGLVDVAYEDGGAQATLCGGIHMALFMICTRGAYLVNRGPELGIFFAANGLGTLGWAK
jgi:hypothetical protein